MKTQNTANLNQKMMMNMMCCCMCMHRVRFRVCKNP